MVILVTTTVAMTAPARDLVHFLPAALPCFSYPACYTGCPSCTQFYIYSLLENVKGFIKSRQAVYSAWALQLHLLDPIEGTQCIPQVAPLLVHLAHLRAAPKALCQHLHPLVQFHLHEIPKQCFYQLGSTSLLLGMMMMMLEPSR